MTAVENAAVSQEELDAKAWAGFTEGNWQGSITIQSISMLAGMELHLPDGTRRTLCGLLNKAEAMRGETEAFCRFTQEPGRFWLDAARAVELTSRVCRVMEQIRREAGISFGKLPF